MINHSVANCMATDWIAIYQPAKSGEGYESWTYVQSCPGSVTMTAPATPGTYKIRYMPNNSYNVAAEVDLVVATVQPMTLEERVADLEERVRALEAQP